jgi:hypothetical protein
VTPYADASVSTKNGLVKSGCWRTGLLIMAVCNVLNVFVPLDSMTREFVGELVVVVVWQSSSNP